ncbi:metal-dependent hydrolase [Puniceicoccaceae bacterium K14]|nr:metal-dependent hydrolase [Puniceicoccaceae bacterium K14]
MDPISQGALGAIASASTAPKKEIRIATLIGWAAGMLADADIFIRSKSDPLLNIEFHRHFSHSLIFIPIGAIIAALAFSPILRKQLHFSKIYLYALLGYATAGLLDACTTYGTQLLWPFSSSRIAWSIISIIDPVFTLTILALLVIGFFKRKAKLSQIAALFAFTYLVFGYHQHQKASNAQFQLAESRGHAEAKKLSVKPSIGNLALWRSLYEHNGQLYIDAIRVNYFGYTHQVYPGHAAPLVDKIELKASIPLGSALAHDIDRFAEFSDDYLIFHPSKENILADARYSMVPNSLEPLWGIEIDEQKPDVHAPFLNFRSRDKTTIEKFKSMLFGKEIANND